jgi:CHASE2 domain-containing sensor protein
MTDPVLEALWKRVVDEWENDAVHGVFIEHCQMTSQLLEAAVRYRGMSGDHARGPVAQKRLQAIAILAVAQLEAARSTRQPRAATATRVALITLFLAGSAALLYLLQR